MSRKLGRPTVMTDEILAKLEEAFSIGASDMEACFVANIHPTSLYRYQEANPEYSTRKMMLKDMPLFQARSNITGAIKKERGSTKPETSKWYLERKKKLEFSTRTETTGAEGGPVEINIKEDTALGAVLDGELVEDTKQLEQITSLI